LGFALLLWLIGMVWGSVVFAIPALKDWGRTDYVSANLAVSVPILIAWAVLIPRLARRHLRDTAQRAAEGLKLGIAFALVAIVLDAVVVAVAFQAGAAFFGHLLLWLGYAMLLLLPWQAGRQLGSV
jgi:hydrogenase-4 membrane subunit HyfE